MSIVQQNRRGWFYLLGRTKEANVKKTTRGIARAFAIALALALVVPTAAFATTYPGAQTSLNLTAANGGIKAYQMNNYVEPAARRLTGGIVVKCSTGSMPANQARSKVYLYNSSSLSISESALKYNQAVSQNQFSYNTTVYSVAAGSKVTARAHGYVSVKDDGGGWTTRYPAGSPMKSSL